MSQSWKNRVSRIESVESQIRRLQINAYGDQENVPLFKDALLLTAAIWDEILLPEGGFLTYPRWLSAIEKIGKAEDVIRILATAADNLLSEEVNEYECFKHTLTSSFPLGGALIAPLKKEIVRWFAARDPLTLGSLRTAFLFMSRLTFRDVDVLKEEAKASYFSNEENLQTDGFTSEEGEVITRWFPRKYLPWAYEHMECRHGPGASAFLGRATEVEKYLNFKTDGLLDYLQNRMSFPPPPYRDKGLERRAEVRLVPKSYKAYRTICMEPVGLMWYQQGAAAAFNRYIKYRYLGKRYTPEDQGPNRSLALEGSYDGYYSTIDLSAASDSVSWALVHQWFHNSWLFPFLVATRSREASFEGEVLTQKKFAPMGSALNFPIEVTVFCAIVECAIRECGGIPEHSAYRVFGDDIVVETEYASAVMARLEKNGFKVNHDKSFTNSTSNHGFFRESCGVEAYSGIDVSPVRVPRRFATLRATSPETLAGNIELYNKLFAYPLARHVVRRSFSALPQYLQPRYSHSGEGALWSPNPTNFHLENRFNTDLQRKEIRCGQIRAYDPLVRGLYLDERAGRAALFEWLRRAEASPDRLEPLSVPSLSRPSLRWKSTWVEDESEDCHSSL